MKAVLAVNSGICCFKENIPKYYDLIEKEFVPDHLAHLICGNISDWEDVKGNNRDEIIKLSLESYKNNRIICNIEDCLINSLSAELKKDLLEEAEDLLKTISDISIIKCNLLKAPFAEMIDIGSLIKQCLSEGFIVLAKIINDINELQPNLRSLSDRWLSIPDEYFSVFAGGRQEIWRLAIKNGIINNTLNATNHYDVEKLWVGLVFSYNKPAEIVGLNRISKEIAHQIFPSHRKKIPEFNKYIEEGQDKINKEKILYKNNAHENYKRVMKQIETIEYQISQGYDKKARRFLKDLIEDQTKNNNSNEYVVKSLCNIAQRCAEMFRTDFEYECLQTAKEISQSDDWTMIQLANHYKRVGQFDNAIETIRSINNNDDKILNCSLADVFVHMGKYEEALKIYYSISGGEYDSSVRIGIADTIRKKGDLEKAYKEYEDIIKDGLEHTRSIAGMAEIAKRKGNLKLAKKYYEDILQQKDIDEQSNVIYKSALAQILVREGDFNLAYKILDEIVQKRPFAQQFIVLRAAVSGLLGKPDDAIKGLKKTRQIKAFDEWVNEYVLGLLLLMLKRYDDARDILLKNLEISFLEKDVQVIVRLGAVVSFLYNNGEIDKAADILNKMPNTDDLYVVAIQNSLKYHIAVALDQKSEIGNIKNALLLFDEECFENIVKDIDRKQFNQAWLKEVGLVLRLAA